MNPLILFIAGFLVGDIAGVLTVVVVLAFIKTPRIKKQTESDKKELARLLDFDSPQTIADEPIEMGEFIQLNPVEDYLDEHKGEEIALGSILEDD